MNQENSTTKEKQKSFDKRVGVLCLTHGVNHGTMLFFSPLLIVIMDQLTLNFASVGLLTAVAFITNGVGTLPAGILSDSFGRKNFILLTLIIPAVGAFIGAVANSYVILIVSFFLIGIGSSFYHPCSYALIADISSDSNRGKVFGYHGIGGNVGSAVTPVLAGAIVALSNWRLVFVFWGLVCIVNAVLVLFILPKQKKASKSLEKQEEKPKGLWKCMFAGTILLALIIIAIQGFVNDGVFAFLPTLLQEEFGATVLVSGLLAGIQYSGGVFGQLAGGYLSDKYNRVTIIIWASIGTAVTTALIPMMGNYIALVVVMFAAGFCLFMLQPPINALLSNLVPAEIMGASFGVVFIFKYGLGALAPALGGVVAEVSGLALFFYILAAVMALSVVFAYIIGKSKSSKIERL